jgi:hypothetical protein
MVILVYHHFMMVNQKRLLWLKIDRIFSVIWCVFLTQRSSDTLVMATPYGKGSRREGKPTLGRYEIVDAMKYLGYVTHDPEGNLFPDVAAVAVRMAGKYTESVMLPTLIATEVTAEKAKTQKTKDTH